MVLAVEHSVCSNFEGGMADLLDLLGGGERHDYRNRFVAAPQGTPIVPMERPPVRSHGPQTARVVA